MTYDVIIIGTGQAGVPLATRLAKAGKTVLIAERQAPGGTCINYGCTPTKTMLASARAAHVARGAGRLGVRTGEVTVDLPAVIARKDKLVSEWSEGIRGQLTSTPGVTLVLGHARFVGPRTIEVAGQRHDAATVIINTGGRPVIPDLPGLAALPWLDSTKIMKLQELPRHLVVLGGGYVACEFGQMFRRFGSRVTMLERDPHLCAREDADISQALEGVLRAEGIDLVLGVEATAARATADGIAIDHRGGSTLGSHLLVAVGRRPNTDDLGCGDAGIALDQRGTVVVNDHYQTSAAGVYAVGDVAGGPQFTHTAWDDHRLLYDILAGTGTRGRKSRLVPYTMFTDPQLARVGLSEGEAKAQGIPYEVASMGFGEIARAIELDETAGTLKLLIDPKSERILGAAIVGIEAGELIHIFVDLIQAGATARAIVDAEHVHPTLAEGIQSLVMKLPRYALS